VTHEPGYINGVKVIWPETSRPAEPMGGLKRKQFCVRGHDDKRNKRGACLACIREREREQRRAKKARAA